MSRARLKRRPVDIAPVFAALGDRVRLSLLSRLKDGKPQSIVQLAEGFELTRQGVSKHLRVLEQVGVVTSERVGRESQFLLDPSRIHDARSYLDRVSEQWDDALMRLKMHVER
ncbi:MAG: helix-turn-helix domain-containing protein [Alphaproteobacteria bacterium]|nr:helix-turn-helix domain-containing protein [Alphaproteobacteria bacterium]